MEIAIQKNSKYGLVVSSRAIAKELGKEHSKVLRTLEEISEKPNMASLIIPSTYRAEGQRRSYKEYLLTKDGFTLYMFNIQGYQDFKMAYIQKFNEMEKMIYSGKQLPMNYNMIIPEKKRDYYIPTYEERIEATREMVEKLSKEMEVELKKIQESLVAIKGCEACIKLYMLQI